MSHKRISQLLDQEAQGNITPSQLLKCQQTLAEESINTIAYHFFRQRISTLYKVALASRDEINPAKPLATIANKIADLLPLQTDTGSGIQETETKYLTKIETSLDKLKAKVEQLTLQQTPSSSQRHSLNRFRG